MTTNCLLLLSTKSRPQIKKRLDFLNLVGIQVRVSIPYGGGGGDGEVVVEKLCVALEWIDWNIDFRAS